MLLEYYINFLVAPNALLHAVMLRYVERSTVSFRYRYVVLYRILGLMSKFSIYRGSVIGSFTFLRGRLIEYQLRLGCRRECHFCRLPGRCPDVMCNAIWHVSFPVTARLVAYCYYYYARSSKKTHVQTHTQNLIDCHSLLTEIQHIGLQATH